MTAYSYACKWKIIIHIVFHVISKITTDENIPEFEDELDKLIELKATRNSYYFFLLGFLFSMSTLVMGFTPMAMFISLAASMIGSCLLNDISQLYLHIGGV